jgi:hypothetical protein
MGACRREKPEGQRYTDGWSRIGLKLGFISEEHKAEPKFKVGDLVNVDHDRIETIEEIDCTHSCIFYGVRFNTDDKRWLFESALQAAPAHPQTA